MPRISRRASGGDASGFDLAARARRAAADAPKEIRIDWATYNPVSLVLKEQGLLEKEFAKDGITVRWVQSAGSNKALEFLNAGSLDFGSTAGAAALVAKINGNPIKSIYVYSRPEWTALVTGKDRASPSVADLKGKRVAVTRGTDPHIFLVRALAEARPDREGREARAAAARRRHARAGARRRRRLGRPRPDDGGGRGRERREAVLSARPRPTPGACSTSARSSPRSNPEIVKRVLEGL